MENVKIKEIRKELDLTQRELADRLKIDPGTVSRLERETNRPSRATVRKLRRLQKDAERKRNGK